ncbi:anti-sigma factor antagonist [Mycolicibacterium sp. CH28]|uniref:STAS domain-containing protein n=1 Tax=Mycolicibacterium sp. CH28 TaxID=2512237 RepID=UPI0010812B2F|nr:STAS domain-containing protein [Mycolicibacterium sp. CH28]TGD86526.1 anti-sigma factor antagonist [Mycolicibacterium sp. CH28]
MSAPLILRTQRGTDGRLAVLVAGEIDASNVTEFAEAVTAATADTVDTVVVDLSAVEYMDSAAINALAPHAESLEIVANPVLMRVLTVSGLAELAKVRQSPADRR